MLLKLDRGSEQYRILVSVRRVFAFYRFMGKKGKVIPLQARCGPEGG